MPEPQDHADHGSDAAPGSATPPEPVPTPPPASAPRSAPTPPPAPADGSASTKKAPPKAVKKAAAKKAPAKKTASKAPANKAPAKKALPAAPEPAGTSSRRLDTGATEAAAHAKSAVDLASSPVAPPARPAARSPVALLVVTALGLLALLVIRQLLRHATRE